MHETSRQSHCIQSMLHEFDALLGISSHHDRHEGKPAELSREQHKESPSSVLRQPQGSGQNGSIANTSIAGFASFRRTPLCGAPYPPPDALSAGGLNLSWSLDDDELPEGLKHEVM